MKKITLNKKKLFELYYKNNFCICKLAIFFKVGRTCIYGNLKRYNIKLKQRVSDVKLNKKILIDLYYNKFMSFQQMSKYLKTTTGYISKNFKKFNLKSSLANERNKYKKSTIKKINKKRLLELKSIGKQILIIWQSDLINLPKLENKILKFSKNE